MTSQYLVNSSFKWISNVNFSPKTIVSKDHLQDPLLDEENEMEEKICNGHACTKSWWEQSQTFFFLNQTFDAKSKHAKNAF